MIIFRSVVCMLLLAVWADGSLAAQQDIITTVAGNGQAGFAGDGGPATEASLNMPGSVAVDAKGNVYIADWQNQRIRKINPAGIISTVAGNGRRGFSGDGGLAINASLDLMVVDPNNGHPYLRASGDIALDTLGNLYIADTNNHRIRKVDTDGVITTVIGGGVLSYLSDPAGLAIDRDGSIYIADTDVVRKVSPDGTVREVACCFWRAVDVAIDRDGNIYVADSYFGYDGMIFKVDTSKEVKFLGYYGSYSNPGSLNENIQPMGGPDFWFSPGAYGNNPWWTPWSLVVDVNGDLLVAQAGNRILKLTKDNKQIFHLAGNNGLDAQGFSGDGGPAREAAFAWPRGIAQDTAGNIYVADTNNNRIRIISSAMPTLTVNSAYCVGSSWSAQVNNAAANSDIRLVGSSNGMTWEIARWGTTQPDGSFTVTGTFAEGTEGSHTLRLQIGGTFSRTVPFVVSDCQP